MKIMIVQKPLLVHCHNQDVDGDNNARSITSWRWWGVYCNKVHAPEKKSVENGFRRKSYYEDTGSKCAVI